MGEIAVRLLVEEGVFHAEAVKQLWQNDASNGVYGIDTDSETSLSDCLYIDEWKAEDALHVSLVIMLCCQVAEVVDIGILKTLFGGYLQHLLSIGCGQELSVPVQQFQCVPVAWVVGCCYYYASVGLCHCYGELSRWG